MGKIRKFSLQSGFERMIDEFLTNWTTEAGFCLQFLQLKQTTQSAEALKHA